MNLIMRSLRVGYSLYVVDAAARVMTTGIENVISGVRDESAKRIVFGVAEIMLGSLAQSGAIEDICDDFNYIRKVVLN